MKQNIIKIVLTGPESSGKTTLAAELATVLDTIWMPEFARFYLSGLGRPYERSDLNFIAIGQSAWEEWYAQRADRYLVCDTDWTVIHVWDYYRFIFPNIPIDQFQNQKYPGFAAPQHPHTPAHQHTSTPALYFLCAPDFPWQPDVLREHPEERDILFDLYETLLQQIKAKYVVLRGNPENRLKTAFGIIANL